MKEELSSLKSGDKIIFSEDLNPRWQNVKGILKERDRFGNWTFLVLEHPQQPKRNGSVVGSWPDECFGLSGFCAICEGGVRETDYLCEGCRSNLEWCEVQV